MLAFWGKSLTEEYQGFPVSMDAAIQVDIASRRIDF
jgi:hypothetical protein